MSIRAVGPGRWQLDYYDEHGKRVRTVVRAPTKAAAERMLSEILLDVSRRKRGLAPEAPNPEGLTVADLTRWWLDGPARRLASRDRTASSLKALLMGRRIAGARADLVSSPDVERWLAELEAEGYAARTVNHARGWLRAIYGKAIRAGKVRIENPVVGTSVRKAPAHAFEVLTLAEVARLLAAREDPVRAIYATAIFTGMRRGELWALRRADVDLVEGVLVVRGSHGRATTKGGKARALPIHPELRPHLARVLLSHTDELVFPSPFGGRRSEDAKTSRDFKAALKAAGIAKTMRFHDLRHTAATLLLQAGAGLAIVQRVLGHASPVTTANTYGHLVVDDLRRAMAAVSLGSDHSVTTEQSQTPPVSRMTRRGGE